jgi:cupin-like protein
MALPPFPFQIQPVQRLSRPTHDELREWHYREPVLVSGLFEHSSLLAGLKSRSTLDGKLSLLGEHFGDREVDFCAMPPESKGHYLPELVPVLGPGDDVSVRGVPFSEFARRLKAAPSTGEYVYMQDGVIEPDSPVRDALKFDFLKFANPQGVRSKFWIGSDGQVFNLHYDDFLNFICMFEGTKRVTMFPPDQLPNMYHAPLDVLCGYAPTTHIKLLEADLERHPKFRTALEHARVAILEPGDALVIPPFWWHHVESFSPMHVMVNNFVTTVPFSSFLELWKCLSEALRQMAHASAAERARARESFHRAVHGDADASREHPLSARAWQVAQTVSPTWRKHLARLYDAFVFQVNGEPFPLSPGGLAAFLERHTEHLTVFPPANLLAGIPELLEIPAGDPQPR